MPRRNWTWLRSFTRLFKNKIMFSHLIVWKRFLLIRQRATFPNICIYKRLLSKEKRNFRLLFEVSHSFRNYAYFFRRSGGIHHWLCGCHQSCLGFRLLYHAVCEYVRSTQNLCNGKKASENVLTWIRRSRSERKHKTHKLYPLTVIKNFFLVSYELSQPLNDF